MKLFAMLATAAMAIEPTSLADCPNSSWEFVSDADGNYCKPKDVVVTCDARQMFVTFTDKHIYKNLERSRVDSQEAAAVVGK